MDELSLEPGNSAVWVDRGGTPRAVEIDGAALGLSRAPVAALRGGTAEENAAIARAVLEGERGPRRDAVVLNAAAAFWIVDRVASLEAGAEEARKTIDSGAAAQTLARYVELSRKAGEE
jgi:anthranilate phosphoribosyltransferase